MRRILFILTLLTCGLFSQAQIPADSSYPTKQSLGNAPTTIILSNAIKVNDGYVNAVFADTTTANLFAQGGKIKYYAGAQIMTYNAATSDSGTLWVRNGLATKWLRGSGSIDITSFTFDNDTTGTICFGNGVCITFDVYNLFDIVTNIIINFNDSSVYNINDSTLIICVGQGAERVCDTINLGNTNKYYFLNDSTLVTCDTLQIICVADSCYEQQVCDTISVPRVTSTEYQNWLRRLPGTSIIEFGGDDEGAPSFLNHTTYADTYGYRMHWWGRTLWEYPYQYLQLQAMQGGTGIVSFKGYGSAPNGGTLVLNQVRMGINSTDSITSVTAPAKDGVFGRNVGYFISTNITGSPLQGDVKYDDFNSKSTGIFLHTRDTPNDYAVSIFGQRAVGSNVTSEEMDTTFIANFNNNKSVQFTRYGDGVFNGTPTYLAAFDADGNIIEYPSGGISGGVLFARDDARNNSGGAMYFSAADEIFFLDSMTRYEWTLGSQGFLISDFASSGYPVVWDSTVRVQMNTKAAAAGGGLFRSKFELDEDIGFFESRSRDNSTRIELGYQISGITHPIGYVQAVNYNSNVVHFLGADTTQVGIYYGTDLATVTRGVEVKSTGVQLISYGSGTFTGTATKWLAVDASGNVIEEDPPSGATYTASELVTLNGSNFEFGGTATVDRTATLGANTVLFTANTLAGDPAISITSTSTAAASSLQRGLFVQLSGTNANSSETTYGVFSTNTHAGTSSTNISVHGSSSSGTTTNIGVNGVAAGTLAKGVQGTTAEATGYGIYGSNSNSGVGIYGQATGTGYGVQAYLSAGTGGVALRSLADASSGTNYGLIAEAGGGTTAYGASFAATGATNNYALMVQSGSGRVVFGSTTSNANALLELASTTQAFIVMRMTAAQASAITPANGMILYTTDTDATFISIGFWVYEAAAWRKM